MSGGIALITSSRETRSAGTESIEAARAELRRRADDLAVDRYVVEAGVDPPNDDETALSWSISIEITLTCLRRNEAATSRAARRGC